jgi:hypothetical protein
MARPRLQDGQRAPPVEVGYFTLPAEGGDISRATWTDAEQAEAIDAAREIVRSIRAGRFPPNDAYAYPMSDDCRFILHRTVLGAAEVGAGAGDGGGGEA